MDNDEAYQNEFHFNGLVVKLNNTVIHNLITFAGKNLYSNQSFVLTSLVSKPLKPITMDKKEIVKEYSNGELTVVWKPEKCIHSGICVKTLPKVYHPKEKPWIKPEMASTSELKSQINKCPSGALSFYLNAE